jgi:hypothetical protein
MLFFLILKYFSVSHSIPASKVFVSLFPRFSFFFFHHIPGPTVCFSHFAHFPVFLAIFQVLPWQFFIFLLVQFSHGIPGLKCVFPILHIFSVSRHIPVPTVFAFPFPRFSIFSP